MLHALEALQNGLQRFDNQLLDFLRRGAGLGDNDIRGWHHDARVLLARGIEDRHDAGEERHQNNEQCQFAVDEIIRNASGDI